MLSLCLVAPDDKQIRNRRTEMHDVDCICYSSTSSRHLRAKRGGGGETHFGKKKNQNLFGQMKKY